MAIINAVMSCFGEDILRLCFFHLNQSVYRHIQASGLQALYNDPDDRSIRTAAHMLCVLAFVPPHDMIRVFLKFALTVPEFFQPIIEYFEVSNNIRLFFQLLKINLCFSRITFQNGTEVETTTWIRATNLRGGTNTKQFWTKLLVQIMRLRDGTRDMLLYWERVTRGCTSFYES